MKSQSEKLIVAFFGPDYAGICRRKALRSWREWTEGLCRALGLVLTHVTGSFEEKSCGMKDYRAYSMRRSMGRFENQLAADNVVEIALDVLEDKKGHIAFDWTLTSSCGRAMRGVRALLGLDCDAICSWETQRLSNLLKQCLVVAKCVEIKYGFATIMPRDYYPASYACGLTSGAAGTKLLHDTAAWRKHAERECGHLLRNLYGWNILTPEHLKIDIGGMPLKDWVNASPKRGRLYEIAPPLWCWTFEDLTEGNEYLKWECEAVESIRQELEGYKLFPWQTIG